MPGQELLQILLPSGHLLADLTSDVAYGLRKVLLGYLIYAVMLPVRLDLLCAYSSQHVINNTLLQR